MQDGGKPKAFNLIAAFKRAADPLVDRFEHLITTYPSKAAAISGAAADISFFHQSTLNGNELGQVGAAIGMLACWHLGFFGDPKISPHEKHSYVDPQDRRNIINWIVRPHEYPWEAAALGRMTYMSLMLLGGLGLGRVSPMSWGEVAYSLAALTGYAVKIGIAEKPKDSVAVPENSKGMLRQIYRLNAYVRENPNPTAGKLWVAGLIPYVVEGMIKTEPYKVASAALYLLPDVLTMMSSKRAQTIGVPVQGPDVPRV